MMTMAELNFNTSYVVVKVKGKYTLLSGSIISIHLMLWLK